MHSSQSCSLYLCILMISHHVSRVIISIHPSLTSLFFLLLLSQPSKSHLHFTLSIDLEKKLLATPSLNSCPIYFSTFVLRHLSQQDPSDPVYISGTLNVVSRSPSPPLFFFFSFSTLPSVSIWCVYRRFLHTRIILSQVHSPNCLVSFMLDIHMCVCVCCRRQRKIGGPYV